MFFILEINKNKIKYISYMFCETSVLILFPFLCICSYSISERSLLEYDQRRYLAKTVVFGYLPPDFQEIDTAKY